MKRDFGDSRLAGGIGRVCPGLAAGDHPVAKVEDTVGDPAGNSSLAFVAGHEVALLGMIQESGLNDHGGHRGPHQHHERGLQDPAVREGGLLAEAPVELASASVAPTTSTENARPAAGKPIR